jgi:hypothetical protein
MRTLNIHKVNPANNLVTVTVIDTPNGEPSTYRLSADEPFPGFSVTLNFQLGPINEVNGITNEVLLAIVRDRLEYFQKGNYACRENALALTKIEETLQWLHWRTRRQMAAGTEGTSRTD